MSIPWQLISQSLFELDPMNTCCKENDCFDEYDFVARHINKHTEQELSLENAIYLSLVQLFDELSAKNVDVKEIAGLIQKRSVSRNDHSDGA